MKKISDEQIESIKILLRQRNAYKDIKKILEELPDCKEDKIDNGEVIEYEE